jgi:hypothetical protein
MKRIRPHLLVLAAAYGLLLAYIFFWTRFVWRLWRANR